MLGVGGEERCATLLYNELYFVLASLMLMLFWIDILMTFFASRYEGQYGLSASWSGRPQLTHFVEQLNSSSWLLPHFLHFVADEQCELRWPRCQHVLHL